MSPEQAAARSADFRADQFSFGAVVYEMLTGKRAFDRRTDVETLAAIVGEEPEAASKLNPQVPLPLSWVIERCLAKDPEDRFASTADLVRDLETIAKHLPELRASASDAASKFADISSASQRALLAVGMVVIAFVAGTIGWWMRSSRIPAAPTLRPLTFSGHDYHPSGSPDGRLIAFQSDRDS